MSRPSIRFVLAALTCAAATAAFAGGPVETFDPVNKIPYAWTMSHWPNGQVPVYTDLGPLGIVNNGAAGDLVFTAVSEWSSVPTTSFRAAVVGDFHSLGLNDIGLANISSIIGTFNGGGIDIVYDNDGSIMTNFFGVNPTQTLGVTAIDFVNTGTPEIVESWCVLSGPAIHSDDPFGVAFNGVVTHEFGHALNLAHTQANGAVWAQWLLDAPQPSGCSAPYTGTAAPAQVETMYPFSDPSPGAAGQYQAYVNHLDDMVAISDIYPAAGWPASKGTIQGQILDPSGNPVTGVNVIARNVANPFSDVTSYIAGQVSKGNAGPDGSFTLNGLTPGARYVLYVDGLQDGAFSVPALLVLPGPEEYYNGAMESADGSTDDRCGWTTITATAGTPVTVNITFNQYAGAPALLHAPALGVPNAITPDGTTIVGSTDNLGPIYRWDIATNDMESLGGVSTGTPSISDDGTKVSGNIVDTDGNTKAAIYQNGAWTPLPGVTGGVACNNSPAGPILTTANAISGDGSTVVGLSYGAGGCYSGTVRGFKWTAAGGTVALPKANSRALDHPGRANRVNYDGSVIVGWDENGNGGRDAEQWRNGTGSLIKNGTLAVGEALGVSRDGKTIVGFVNSATSGNTWRYLAAPTSTLQSLGQLPGYNGGLTYAVSDDGGVITGYSTDSNSGALAPTLWTSALHLTDFNQFLTTQGVYLQGVYPILGTAMTPDAHTIVGYESTKYGSVGWVLKMPSVMTCHQQQTTIVSFPQGMNAALTQGDTLGPCQCSASAPTTGVPKLYVNKPAAGIAELSMNSVIGATGFDISRGSLTTLRGSGGDFAAATTDCLEDNLVASTRDDSDTPSPGNGFWYVVRATNCGGHGSYDSGAPTQIGSRDAEIALSPATCP